MLLLLHVKSTVIPKHKFAEDSSEKREGCRHVSCKHEECALCKTLQLLIITSIEPRTRKLLYILSYPLPSRRLVASALIALWLAIPIIMADFSSQRLQSDSLLITLFCRLKS